MNLTDQPGLSWDLLPLLIALIAISGAGSLLVRLLSGSAALSPIGADAQPARSPAWGWSFLLGMCLVGLTLQFPLLDGRISRFSFWAILALCGAMSLVEAALRLRDRKQRAASARVALTAGALVRRPAGWIANLPLLPRLAVLLCLGIFVWFAAVEPPSSFDARAIYALKGRMLYDRGSLHDEDFRDPDLLNFHANYPLLFPLAEATLFTAEQSTNVVGLRLLFAGFVLACASILVEEIGRFETPNWAAFWGACFVLLPFTLAPTEGGGMSGSADYPMAAFVTAGIIAIGRWLTKPDRRSAILAGLMLGAAALTKREGTIWLATAYVALEATMYLRRTRLSRPMLRSGLIAAGLAVGCVLLAALNRRGIPDSPFLRSFEQILHWDWLVKLWHRPLFILQYAFKQLVSLNAFNFLIPFVLVALLLTRRPKAGMLPVFWRSAVLLVVATYYIIFAVTPLHIEYQLRTSMFRLTVHFLPLLLLIVAEQVHAAGLTAQVHWILTGKSPDEAGHLPFADKHREPAGKKAA